MASNRKIRVGLLFGGRSPEHEISITTAAAIAKEADPERFEVRPIWLTRDGRWLELEGPGKLAALAGRLLDEGEIGAIPRQEVLLSGADEAALVPTAGERSQTAEPIDVLFPALHGRGGEDGSIQGLARLVDVPCVGAGILGSALGMDKITMKRIAIAHGVRVPSFIEFTRDSFAKNRRSILDDVASKLTLPVFVKPSGTGSSVGITKVKESARLEEAIEAALPYDYRLLVEQGIDAREMEVALMGNDDPIASVVGEIVPGAEFYDYRAKYLDQGSQAIIPADIPEPVSRAIREQAVRLFRALDLAGMARADFLLDRSSGHVYFNEVNTIPGFTPISMYPMLMEASGVPYRELITRLVDLAIERHRSTRVDTDRPRI